MNQPYANKPCPHCGRFTNRGLSANAIIINNGRALLVRRGREPFKGFWAVPGGYVGWDETVEEAAIREVQEETGLVATNATFVNIFSAPSRHPDQLINCSYIVQVIDFSTLRAGDDAEDVRWFPLEDLPETMAFDHRQQIDTALRRLKQ